MGTGINGEGKGQPPEDESHAGAGAQISGSEVQVRPCSVVMPRPCTCRLRMTKRRHKLNILVESQSGCVLKKFKAKTEPCRLHHWGCTVGFQPKPRCTCYILRHRPFKRGTIPVPITTHDSTTSPTQIQISKTPAPEHLLLLMFRVQVPSCMQIFPSNIPFRISIRLVEAKSAVLGIAARHLLSFFFGLRLCLHLFSGSRDKGCHRIAHFGSFFWTMATSQFHAVATA